MHGFRTCFTASKSRVIFSDACDWAKLVHERMYTCIVQIRITTAPCRSYLGNYSRCKCTRAAFRDRWCRRELSHNPGVAVCGGVLFGDESPIVKQDEEYVYNMRVMHVLVKWEVKYVAFFPGRFKGHKSLHTIMLKGSLPCRNFSSLQKPFSPFFSYHWINFVFSEGSGNILLVHCSADLGLHERTKRFESTSGRHAPPQADGHLQCYHETVTLSPAQSSLFSCSPLLLQIPHKPSRIRRLVAPPYCREQERPAVICRHVSLD